MDWGVSPERISSFWRVGSRTRKDVQADRQFDHSSVCQLAELGAVRFVFLLIERHWRRTARQHLWKSCSNPEACRQFTKTAKATGLENVGPERTRVRPSGRGPVNSPTRITPENNGKTGRSRIGRTLSQEQMAERVGFEPTEPLQAQRFSRPPRSTTPAPLRALGW
jgi:hypothetical protein